MGLGVELVGQWPGSKVVEVAQKHFLSVGFSLLMPAYQKRQCLKGKPKEKHRNWKVFYGTTIHAFGQRNGAKENCRICSFSVSLKEKP